MIRKSKTIFKFFMNKYNLDLSTTKIYIIDLVGKNGAYDYIEDEVYIDHTLNAITRELTLVHELTHKIVYVLELDVIDEEAYCKEVTLEYVKQEFNEVAVTLVKNEI
jgi:Zn-dependent peptidase ImmA (M78 family)